MRKCAAWRRPSATNCRRSATIKIDAVKAYRGVQAELAGAEALLADPATDAEMRGMAETERDELQAKRDDQDRRGEGLSRRAGGTRRCGSPARRSRDGCGNARHGGDRARRTAGEARRSRSTR